MVLMAKISLPLVVVNTTVRQGVVVGCCPGSAAMRKEQSAGFKYARLVCREAGKWRTRRAGAGEKGDGLAGVMRLGEFCGRRVMTQRHEVSRSTLRS